MTVYGTANLQFFPHLADGTTELNVEMNIVDIKFTEGINITNFNATADISTFHVDKINVVSSTIGDISAAKLKIDFNTISRLAVPELNKFIQNYSVHILDAWPKNRILNH